MTNPHDPEWPSAKAFGYRGGSPPCARSQRAPVSQGVKRARRAPFCPPHGALRFAAKRVADFPGRSQRDCIHRCAQGVEKPRQPVRYRTGAKRGLFSPCQPGVGGQLSRGDAEKLFSTVIDAYPREICPLRSNPASTFAAAPRDKPQISANCPWVMGKSHGRH